MRRRLHPLRFLAGLLLLSCLVLLGAVLAQGPGGGARPRPPVNQSTDPLLKNFRWRSIGPASMSGRIDDIAVAETNPNIIVIGYATSGVWKSINNGVTFEPIFDTYSSASIGDVAISPTDPNIIWVGTGEPNNRQSSTYGDGIYKSTDGGKTFAHMGLKETQTIARIVIDPRNNDTLYVAVPGHLFGPNKERGVYKTTDGGKTWTNVKFIDEDTGFTDITIDTKDPNTLYAASYQRRRTPWGFNGGGQGSALWKTTDAGKTWMKIEGNGWPTSTLGRIAVEVSRSNPNYVYAHVEVGNLTPTVGGAGRGGGAGGGAGGGGGNRGGAANRCGQGDDQPLDPKRNGVWRSMDKGKTWEKVSNQNNRPMYYSQIRVDPQNEKIVWTGGIDVMKSTEAGKNFCDVQNNGIAHTDNHALWIDPKNGNHAMAGNDGGLNVTYDGGESWEFINTMAVGLFYAVAADMRKPYYVCGGLQDNGSWCGPSQTRTGGGGFGGGGGGGATGITNDDWYRIGGGDGFYAQVDPTDYNTIYTESQDGNISRVDLKTGRRVAITPRGTGTGRGGGQAQPSSEATPETPTQQPQGAGGLQRSNVVPPPPPTERYRFYWNTPIILSPHNPRLVYVGGDRLFTSRDRGDTWTASADLTRNVDRNKLAIMGVRGDQPMISKNDGLGSYSQIVTIGESPVQPGVIWIGTNDGYVQLSRDGGATWTNVSSKIPGMVEHSHVSRVEPSHFDAGTCYVTMDNHRLDDLKPYVFVTHDFGATWQSIVSNLPAMGNANVIREDPKNKSLLYLGTEFALYVSLDGGKEWKKFMTGLPTVRIDDILVHPRDNDLIVGTHGRSIYIMDDITPLQQLSEKVMAEEAHLFDPRPAVQWNSDITLSRYSGGGKNFVGENPQRGTAISYYVKGTPSEVKLTISDITGKVVRTLTGPKEAGLQRVQWNMSASPPPMPAGQGGGRGGGPGAPPGGAAGTGGAAQGASGGATGASGAANSQDARLTQLIQSGNQEEIMRLVQSGEISRDDLFRVMQASGGGGRGGFGFGGQPVAVGTYLVKLTVDGKDYTTKIVVEADPGKE